LGRFGGSGGTGAGSGGSAIAFFTWNNGAGGELRNTILNPGTPGNGGIGGQGGSGGPGGGGAAGGFGPDNGGNGGNGGAGGNGGQGGNGGNGVAGLNLQLYESGNLLALTNDGWPYAETYTVNSGYGCTNSVVGLTKSAGNWNFAAMNTAPINDVLPGVSSFSNSDNSVQVAYDLQGPKDLVTELSTINDFFTIRDNRALPSIQTLPDSLCAEAGLNLSTSASGAEFAWTVLRENGIQVTSAVGNNPDAIDLLPGKYFVKLQVRDECCGWSVPVYDSTVVREPSSLVALFNICPGDSVFIAGEFQSTSGVYPQTITNDQGCLTNLINVLIIDPCVDFGCTDPLATNYNPLALEDDGSCTFVTCEDACGPGLVWSEELQECIVWCPGDLNIDGLINATDLSLFLSVFGTTCN
jgi:hypothetical protein